MRQQQLHISAENSLYEISISHSRELTSVMASPRLVGVDIQKLVGKIDRIASKFMTGVEMECLDEKYRLEHLHVFWGAKEALYKAYGRKQLDFRQHIFVWVPFPESRNRRRPPEINSEHLGTHILFGCHCWETRTDGGRRR